MARHHFRPEDRNPLTEAGPFRQTRFVPVFLADHGGRNTHDMHLGRTTELASPALLLLLPIGLALAFRRKALAAPAEARSAVWFSSFRFLRYLTLGTIAFWWVLTDLVGLKQAAWQLWLETMPEWIPAGRAVFLVCFWIPPMAVLILCQALFEPVYVRIREIHWSKGELATRAALGLGASLVPLLFVVGGVLELTSGADFKDFALCFALAAAFLLVANRALRGFLVR